MNPMGDRNKDKSLLLQRWGLENIVQHLLFRGLTAVIELIFSHEVYEGNIWRLEFFSRQYRLQDQLSAHEGGRWEWSSSKSPRRSQKQAPRNQVRPVSHKAPGGGRAGAGGAAAPRRAGRRARGGGGGEGR